MYAKWEQMSSVENGTVMDICCAITFVLTRETYESYITDVWYAEDNGLKTH